jgi:hypothetical protein
MSSETSESCAILYQLLPADVTGGVGNYELKKMEGIITATAMAD